MNIQCPVHGEHGNTRDDGKTCGLCYAEGKSPVPSYDDNPAVIMRLAQLEEEEK